MKYTDLTKQVQDSFIRDLVKVIEEVAKEVELYGFTEPLDFDLVDMISSMIDEKAESTLEQWADFVFTLNDDDLEILVIEQLKAIEQMQPTTEQITVFQDLSVQLGKEPLIPEDFLEFIYELAQLEELYKAKSPATAKVKNDLKSSWFEETGEKLRLSRNVTNEEIDEYYILLQELPFKPIKNVRMQLTDKNVRMYHEVAIVREGFEEITRDDYELLIYFDTDEAQYELLYAPSYPERDEWNSHYVAHRGKGYCNFCGEHYDMDKEFDDVCKELSYLEESTKQLLGYLYKTSKEKFVEQNIPVRDALRV